MKGELTRSTRGAIHRDKGKGATMPIYSPRQTVDKMEACVGWAAFPAGSAWIGWLGFVPRSNNRGLMMRRLWVLLALAGIVCPGVAAERAAREDLGRKVKLTILVDKVMQPQAKWVTEEWMVKATAEAGFNVLSPRAGYDRLDEVRQVAQWCKKCGIYYMPWMRGSLSAPAGAAAAGRRMVWANGSEQPLWSPNSDEFWEWTTRYIVEYAKMSAENQHFMGVFLDYENYAPGRQANLYDLSYDDVILAKFAAAQGIKLPELALDKRKAWLDESKLAEQFSQFQIKHWRERCRTLRQAVDRLDPRFQFCIYPAPGTPFMVQATYPEWSTARAPMILADPWVYGRPGRFLPEKEALQRNREKLIAGMRVAQDAGIPFIYAGGIDPVVRGADPEFSGKNAVMISELTGGYWIFYEGPTYTKQDHADYWKWFTWANRAIAAGKFQVWHDPRQTPEDWGLGATTGQNILSRVLAPPKSRHTSYPPVKLRGANLLVVACQAGQESQITIKDFAVGKSQGDVVWRVRSPTLEQTATGTIAHGQSGAIRFTAPNTGLYLVEVTVDGCAWSVTSSNVPVGLYAGDALRVIGPAKRLYFALPSGCRRFEVQAQGQGVETVRINVFHPEGKLADTGQTVPQENKIRIKVSADKPSDQPWSLEITRAEQGVLEDSSLKFDPAVVPLLSLAPEEVFRLRADKPEK